MVPKNQKKSKADGEKNHRAAQKPNKEGLACPECWLVPETVRNDGFSTARHEPGPGARKFRDTPYCNGQGRAGRYVLDKNWKPGKEPENSISGEEYLAHGTKRHEAREAKRQERAEAKSKPKAPKVPKAKAAKPAVKPKKAKSGKKGKAAKAEPAAAERPTDASTEEPKPEVPSVEAAQAA